MALSVTALSPAHEVANFDCGTDELNVWLRDIASQHMKKHISKTYVLVNDDEPGKILGFYALAIRAMTPKEELPLAVAKKLPRNVPGYTLGRLAVSKAMKGRGLGADLLMNAMDRVRAAAEYVGGYAFFVDAKDAQAAAFYAYFGFAALPSDPLTLFMPIADFPK
ncbi:GNAT family N-acetyltransferase [Pseudoduganella ginsengisoli]|uniref:GNAT family N-acetyltransferase n=1 Tax=Pseudoduganella ginsengisoli TaxID=1462440 RepID=A0A6L6Q3P5_9BURK|nr:GNAT family N-acetyltransferase [Pseudoduganella ginsengisoli]MTW04467.1 GNAT family N-acetyltransferase [Pseudoduganella ginsengisoli]